VAGFLPVTDHDFPIVEEASSWEAVGQLASLVDQIELWDGQITAGELSLDLAVQSLHWHCDFRAGRFLDCQFGRFSCFLFDLLFRCWFRE